MSVNTNIILRQSLDWEHISMEDFRRQSRTFCKLINRPEEQVNDTVDLWNRTFKQSFFYIRHKIKEIARENLMSVMDAEILDSNIIDRLKELNDQSCYIFIDDDDWLYPNISSLIRNIHIDSSEVGIVWKSAVFGSFADKIISYRKADGFCYTNNYAFFGRFLNQHEQHLDNVFQHFGANTVLKDHKAKIVDECWSITNKNPSSTVYLEKILKENFSSEALKKGIREYLKRCEIIAQETDPSIAWALPLMSKTIDLFLKLD